MPFKIYFRALVFMILMSHSAWNSKAMQIYAHSGTKTQIISEHCFLDSLLLQAEREYNAKRAVEMSEKAFQMASGLKVPLYLARAAHQSGVAWKNFAEPNKSLERLTLALQTYRDLKMPLEEHVVLGELGETYRAAFQHALAMTYLKKARAYFQSINDALHLAWVYDRMAATQFEMLFSHPDYETLDTLANHNHRNYLDELKLFPVLSEMYHSATRYVDSALLLAAQHDLMAIAVSSGILHASLANLSFNVEKSVEEYEVLIRQMKETGFDRDLPLALINQARIIGKYRMNQPRRAIVLAEQALALAIERDIPVYQFLASEVLHDNYLAMKDFETAYHLLGGIKKLYERLQFDNMKLVVAAREYEFSMQQSDRELQHRRKMQRMILIISIVIVLAISGFLIIYSRANGRLKRLLKSLREQSGMINNQNQQLALVNSQKDRLISIIAHDLRNPFNTILGFSEMIQEDLHTREPAEIRRLLGMIRSAALQTMQLLTSLLEWSRFQEGKIPFNPDKWNTNLVVHEALQILFVDARLKGVTLQVQIDEGLTMFADKNMMVMALRNLVNNAIKYTPRGGNVWVHAAVEDEQIKFFVQDTGVGMDAATLNDIFKVDVVINTPGTDNERGSGFGLVLCEQFIRKHGGKIWAESEVGKGSVFYFTIPMMEVGADGQELRF
jgi:signal transduction histidine kinase